LILADGGLLDAAHTFDQIINKIGDKKWLPLNQKEK
jgi:hypothetical protein